LTELDRAAPSYQGWTQMTELTELTELDRATEPCT
jgi:hypothetical protein